MKREDFKETQQLIHHLRAKKGKDVAFEKSQRIADELENLLVLAFESNTTRNGELLVDFVAYCRANPDQRFWQALCNWVRQEGHESYGILIPQPDGNNDPFSWEGKHK